MDEDDDTMDEDELQDLHAFERRLHEIIAHYKPISRPWQVFVACVVVATAFFGFYCIQDMRTNNICFMDAVLQNPAFLVSFLIMVTVFAFKLHHYTHASQIMVERMKYVLVDFNLSCTDEGKLLYGPPQQRH